MEHITKFKDIEDLGINILGDNFNILSEFFADILKKCLFYESNFNNQKQYLVVFLKKRGLVLMECFLEIFEKTKTKSISDQPNYLKEINLEDIRRISNHFILSQTAIDMSEIIVDDYLKTGMFPNILIIDELMNYGQSANEFYLDLTENLDYYFEQQKRKVLSKNGKVENELLNNINFYIYASPLNRTLLLFSKLSHNGFECKHNFGNKKCNLLSFNFDLFTSIMDKSNLPFSWSLRISKKDYQISEVDSNFSYIKTDLEDFNQDNFIYGYPNLDSPKIVGIVRIKETCIYPDSENNNLIITPFLFFDNITQNDVNSLYQKIIVDLKSHPFLQPLIEKVSPWKTTVLILNYLLLRKFLNENFLANEKLKENWMDNIDWFQVEKNTFPAFNSTNIDLLKKIWDWNPSNDLIDKYLNIITNDANFIYSNSERQFQSFQIQNKKNNFFCDKKDMKNLLNILGELKYCDEQHSFEKSESSVSFCQTSLADRTSYYIQEIFKKCNSNKIEILTNLIQMTEFGVIDINYQNIANQIFPTITINNLAMSLYLDEIYTYMFFLKDMKQRYSIEKDFYLELDRLLGRISDCNKYLDKPITEISLEKIKKILTFLKNINQNLEDFEECLCGFDIIDKIQPRTKKSIKYIDEYFKKFDEISCIQNICHGVNIEVVKKTKKLR